MNENSSGRVLVVDIRADRIGYAAFETPGQLIGYGTSRFNSEETRRARVEFFLEMFTPSVVVLRRPRMQMSRRPHWILSRKMIELLAKKLDLPIVSIAEDARRALFAEFNCRNKFETAALLGSWYPEIARYVPRARKCYEPEPWVTALFDAIALGVAYFVFNGRASHFASDEDGVFSSASK